MKLIRKWLLYAGLDKAQFDSLKGYTAGENLASLKWYSVFATIFFALLS